MTTQSTPMQRVARFIGQNPLIPLVVLLLLLVGVLEFMRPGIVNERWIGNTIKFAIPLAMLAACQTLTMLTGGIDLSASVAATISAFVMATQVPIVGVPLAICLGLLPAILIGLVNGFGVAACLDDLAEVDLDHDRIHHRPDDFVFQGLRSFFKFCQTT